MDSSVGRVCVIETKIAKILVFYIKQKSSLTLFFPMFLFDPLKK